MNRFERDVLCLGDAEDGVDDHCDAARAEEEKCAVCDVYISVSL